MRDLPNFLIIGAAKSGTSALYRYIGQHPDVFMSPVKEPHFFGYEDAPPNAQGPDDFVNTAITNLHDYKDLFTGVTTERAIGEASPTYLYLPRAVERIRHHIPEAKLIAVLRHPADRAFSAYMHVMRDHRETAADFREALRLEDERIAANWGPIWHYTAAGFYSQQLSRYYKHFGRDQIRVYLYDDFVANPTQLVQDMFRFLDVDSTFSSDMRHRVNVSGMQKSKSSEFMIERLFSKPNPVRTAARRLFSEDIRWKFTTRVRNRNLVKQVIPPDIRVELTEIFRGDILNLQDLLHQDLSCWLRRQ